MLDGVKSITGRALVKGFEERTNTQCPYRTRVPPYCPLCRPIRLSGRMSCDLVFSVLQQASLPRKKASKVLDM